MLVQVNRSLKRNRALDTGRVQGRIVAALHGYEVLSRYSRCCDSCLERRVMVRQAGVNSEQARTLSIRRSAVCQPPRRLPWRGAAQWQGLFSSRSGTPRDSRFPPITRSRRFVRSEERPTQNHYRRGKLQPETTGHEWLWITSPRRVARQLSFSVSKLPPNIRAPDTTGAATTPA